MTKVIVTTDTDGNVAVCQPAPHARLVTTDNGIVPFYNSGPIRQLPPDDIPWAETEDEFVQRIREKDIPDDAINVTIVEDTDLPGRKFRNAWKQDAEGKPTVDMPKARNLHMDKIREVRNEELKKERRGSFSINDLESRVGRRSIRTTASIFITANAPRLGGSSTPAPRPGIF